MTTQTWNDPTAWSSGLMRAADINRELKENLNYLYKRNSNISTIRNGSNIATADVKALTLTTTGGNVKASVKLSAEKSSAADDMYFDIRVDLQGGSTIYASSGTSTPLVRGISYWRQGTANFRHAVVFSIMIENIPAGTHTFTLTQTATVGTVTTIVANTIFQFFIEEYGSPQTNVITWRKKRDWKAGENVTSGKLDTLIKERMERLYQKNYNYIKTTYAIAATTASTSFVELQSDESLKIWLYTLGNDVNISWLSTNFNITAAAITYLDFKIDDDYFVSSLTSTALSDGCYNENYNAAQPRGCCFNIILTGLDEGWHSFEPYFKTSVGANPAAIAALATVQFMVEEYCLTGQ